ncbi:NlpC/P60 family peptidoglycan-binding protein RipD [Mycolicibacterium mengxianglii]|uniref:NlpC/P60 family peptidoglycan-binding protein RipD n=1 Tax=Mycolicibacterium mengxianglii TaxID=2736649 RepID=UPI0018D0016D|nr:NlpC/P60 family peptidoglycan-binding protein RipD [Mycolicibacterium mengxianglii]
MRRLYAVVCSSALVLAVVAGTALGTSGVAAADPFGRTPAQLQAISDVIGRALSARGVPFTYGGGNADGPTRGTPRQAPSEPAVVVDSAATGLVVPPSLGLSLPQVSSPTVVVPDPAADVVGFDASGLIVYAFAGVGIKLPRSSGEQYLAARKVQPAMALPGDLIFYGPDGTQSVALFIGNGQMVETTDSGVSVSAVRTNGMTPYLGRIIG